MKLKKEFSVLLFIGLMMASIILSGHIPRVEVLAQSSKRVKGIDVREDINWSEVYHLGYRFVFVKATEGVNWAKPGFEKRVEDARRAGFLVGVYHFGLPVDKEGNPLNKAKDEAESFLQLAGNYLKEGYLRPALDIEDIKHPKLGELHPELLGKEKLAQWIKEWMDTVEGKTGVRPILYMNSFLFYFLRDSTIVDQYDIWIADPINREPTSIDFPETGGWKTWAFWQYQRDVNLANGKADLNLFNGDETELRKFIITPAKNFDIVLVIDRSGSMGDIWQGEMKIDSAKKSAEALINVILPGNRIALITFATDAHVDVHLTSNFDAVKNAISKAWPGGYTNIGEALKEALNELETGIGVMKAIVFFTDGHITTGMKEEDVLEGPVKEAIDKKIKIYTIGYGDPSYLREEFLRKMAESTGGKYYYASDSFKLENIFIESGLRTTGWKIESTFTGSVKEGEIVKAGTFNVAFGTDSIRVVLNWKGSNLDLKIYDPLGKEINFTAPNVIYSGDVKPEYVIIKNPLAGPWTVKVYGKIVPQKEEYYVWISTYVLPSAQAFSIHGYVPLLILSLIFLLIGIFTWRSISKKSLNNKL
ncbi:GH25 family lysozyme [Candidatus Methanodesulfokora washburnensis]|jgi:lysozyme|uniref:VWA domain-containing protein n=1 Tax=Candidatus Methanodesulfokora washburnensis TaxID=2478471 RepID=A0A429GQU6_9CREN|nr:GH25 family lysozyme [Candidatus Methanodesulfokores washburnensis]RSN76248.1 VWA domain-containing protein [Candidatus Methanodesulfokores washburnensis]